MTSRRPLCLTACVLGVMSALAAPAVVRLEAAQAVQAVQAVRTAQYPRIAALSDPPPVELEDPIEAILAPGGQRVIVGGKTLDFWWVKSMPLVPATAEVSWAAVEEGTLVGAVKLSAPYPDIRGKTIQAGLYTLRYGIQPQNGNHLGVSPYRDFLLLSPAAVDGKIAALGHDDVVALAKQTPGVSHPPSWSLDPPVAPVGPGGRGGPGTGSPRNVAAPGATRRNAAGQTAVIFSVPVSREGKDAGVLTFGLVLVGATQP